VKVWLLTSNLDEKVLDVLSEAIVQQGTTSQPASDQIDLVRSLSDSDLQAAVDTIVPQLKSFLIRARSRLTAPNKSRRKNEFTGDNPYKRHHLDMVKLIIEELQDHDFSQHALEVVIQHRNSIKKKEPQWFVKANNFESATNDALAAKLQASLLMLEPEVFSSSSVVAQALALDVCLSASDASIRNIALKAVEQLPSTHTQNNSHVDIIAETLADTDSSIRVRSCQLLGSLGGKPYAEKVSLLLPDKNFQVRIAALEVLGRMGEAGYVYADAVAAMFGDSTPHVRETAITTLGILCQNNTTGRAHADAIAGMLGGTESEVAVKALAVMGAHGGRAAAAMLTNSECDVRAAACKALGLCETGVDHAGAVAVLVADHNHQVREQATNTLCGFGALAAGSIVPLLKSADSSVQLIGLELLGEMAAGVCAYSPQVAALLADEESSVRAMSLAVLGKMGEVRNTYSSQVAPLLGDEDSGVRAICLEVLGKMGQSAQQYSSQVAVLLRDREWRVRSVAIKALGEMGEEARACHAAGKHRSFFLLCCAWRAFFNNFSLCRLACLASSARPLAYRYCCHAS
jgi:HEAT repeat protein